MNLYVTYSVKEKKFAPFYTAIFIIVITHETTNYFYLKLLHTLSSQSILPNGYAIAQCQTW